MNNLLGQKFGRLTVIKKSNSDRSRRSCWICICSCGKETRPVRSYSLIKGLTLSCGCLVKDKIREIRSLPNGEASLNSLFYDYKNNALKRGLEFSLNLKEFKEFTSKICYYCGSEPSKLHRSKVYKKPYIYNGLDRIDSTLGYFYKNIVSCCYNCNRAKSNLSIEEFDNWVGKLVSYNVKNTELRSSVTPIILVLNEVYWILNVLKSIDDHFNRIIVFDAGSNDGTVEAINSYLLSGKIKSSYLYEGFPKVDSRAQLAYRNAPIAEVKSEYYMLVDGDEIWPEQSLIELAKEFPEFANSNKLYGIVNRVEVSDCLKKAYLEKDWVPHHRLYHRTCTWKISHPGERARIPQSSDNEFSFSKKVKMFHMHNTLRSINEDYALSRIQRKKQGTYHPGSLIPFNLLEEVPSLKKPFIYRDKNNKELIQPALDKILKENGI